MQHVLIIGKVWPEPGSSAAGSRTLQLIEQFRQRNWLVSFASAAADSEFSSPIEDNGLQKFNIRLNDSSFDTFIKEQDPSIVIFDRFTLEEQFGWRVADNCPNALRVLDTIDLHCLREARHQCLKQQKEFEPNDLLTDLARREIASIYRCDLTLMISMYEMNLLENFFKIDKRLIHYTPFLLGTPGKTEISQWPLFSDRRHFVSIGNFLHEPNWDSVNYLKKEIWPLIRKELPKAELHIYGAYATQKVFELHNLKEGFLIKGRAAESLDVLKKARVLLAPLRFGAGMKGKLIDSMLSGTPNVTTPIGAEAMHGNLPWNGIIADETRKFAAAAVNLYNDDALWNQSVENGITIIHQYFSKQEHGQNLVSRLLTIKNQLAQHRKTNFIGSMLQHQHTAATKYMSLWIETKNKLNSRSN